LGLGNVVVSGGMGFIGSHFVRKLLAGEGKSSVDSLINIDYMGYGSNPRNLVDVKDDPKYRFIRTDINDINSVGPIRNVDVLVNFAAETHVDRSIVDPKSFIHSNLNGVVSLLEFCRKNDVKTFVQISTDEVYGDATGSRTFHEDSPLKPSSPYSASKASADLVTMSYFYTYGLRTMITRSCNNFGPYQFPEKFVPKSIILSLKGQSIPIYGNGNQKREWLYVEDNASAILQVIFEGEAGEVYNISSSRDRTNMKMIDDLSSILLHKFGIKMQVRHVEDRPGHDRRYSIDTSKIRALGWKESYSFRKALELTVDWYVKNEEWWKARATGRVLHSQPWKIGWKKKYEKNSGHRR
jgi:dTDP-glucose 4,6-dehydratase